MCRSKYVIIAILILLPVLCRAQFDKAMENAFNNFKKNTQQQMDNYSDSVNKMFAEFLAQRWEKFQSFQGLKQQEKPKPVAAPITNPTYESFESVELEYEITTEPNNDREIEEIQPTKKQSKTSSNLNLDIESGSTLSFNVYGNECYMKYPKQFASLKLEGTKEPQVAAFWEKLSKMDFEQVSDKCLEIRDELQLNDWGLYQICLQTAREFFKSNEDEQVVMTVFLLNQLGYNAKIGFSSNCLIALLPFTQQVYSKPYLTIDGEMFFIYDSRLSNSLRDVYTYRMNFPDASKSIDLNILSSVNLENVKVLKTHFFKSYEKTIKVPISAELINFYSNYPQTEISVYARAKMNSNVEESLMQQIKPLVEAKTKTESVAVLLQFLHQAFDYKTDDSQFGQEKPFFAEEMFYYPYSDCEDRAILFAKLVKKTTNFDVVLVQYQDHIATAVRFDEPVSGDYFKLNNEKYIICDPTYINASIGQSIPDYKGKTAKIIRM